MKAPYLELKKLRDRIRANEQDADLLNALATSFRDLGISIPHGTIQSFVADLFRGFSDSGEYFVPPTLLSVVHSLLEGRSAKVVCDPWAGLGVLALTAQEIVHAAKTIACVLNPHVFALGRILAPGLQWHFGNPLIFLDTLSEPLDVVVSVPPFGLRARDVPSGVVYGPGDFAQTLLTSASRRLSPDGIGLFVVAPSFFSFASNFILRELAGLGLSVEAALTMPAGSFAPFTNLTTYLIVIRKQRLTQMFVAQLSQDTKTNDQILKNLQEKRADGAVELGRFVSPEEFRGFNYLRLTEQLQQAEKRLHVPGVHLGELAKEIRLGRPGNDFAFPQSDNAIYIPLIGISDVVDSPEAMTLKLHNYAQVLIDSTRSDARFVARFLNSELGRSIREANKAGTTIPKLNKTGLRELTVFIPDLDTQRVILEVETRLTASQNTVLGLQNDLATLRRALWNNPQQVADLDSRLRALNERLAKGPGPHVVVTVDQWIETLPFPLASILRAWQATPTNDFKTKYEHLLRFFEATAEFLSIIFLSAFASKPALFTAHKEKLTEAWKKQHLSLERATFGTWKVVVEYFSKQTRELLSGDSEKRVICTELFADPTHALPMMLARTELATVLSLSNKWRNDWSGHGAVVGDAEAQLRNERLLGELQKLRELMADTWRDMQLVRALYCRPRGGGFDNEVAVMVGSNSEFLKESRRMSAWLDVERLYLASQDSSRALLLLPLMQVGPSPASAKNACYFYSRIEKDGARFVSYHFVDQPELKDQSDNTSAAIRLLSEVSTGNDY
jgi:hypothetical protein